MTVTVPQPTRFATSLGAAHGSNRATTVPRSAAVVFLLLALSACGGGETRTVVDPGGGGGGGGGGDAQKATLTVTVRPSTDDASVFIALGWADAVPGATVVVQRSGSATRLSATADAQGVATFADLVPGSYSVSALRSLTAAERAQLGTADQDVDAIAGAAAAAVSVQAPNAATQLVAYAGRRGSLVVSELYRDYPRDASGAFYYFGHFLELYNNADTAVALADKVLVEGEPGWSEFPSYSCAQMEPTINDPDGIWASNLYAFPPGTAPLLPGRTVVLATDAIDHTQFVPSGAFDLSHATFEFLGSSDVDNPAVPNMVPLGPGSGDTGLHHGLIWYQVWEVVALAEAVDVASLPHGYWHELDDQPMARVPADKLLDVLTDDAVQNTYPDCPQAVNARFDRQSARVITGTDTRSLQRKVVATLPDGRKVLLRTKTSARDFEADAPTPFAIP